MSGSMRGMWKRNYGKVTWAPPDAAATDKPNLLPPRHISTLPMLLRPAHDWNSAAAVIEPPALRYALGSPSLTLSIEEELQ